MLILKVHITLGKDASMLDQFKLLAPERMEGMRNSYSAAFLSPVGCSREVIETVLPRKDPAAKGRGTEPLKNPDLCGNRSDAPPTKSEAVVPAATYYEGRNA
jgi:hypothetical protein